MVALYEQSSDLVYQQLIPVVLPNAVGERLRSAGVGGENDVLKEIRDISDLAEKDWDSWEKMAFYESANETVTLTPLGLALQQVLVSKRSADTRSSDL